MLHFRQTLRNWAL